MRIAFALCFLSAVTDRFGLCGKARTPNVAWGTYAAFLKYTRALLGTFPEMVVRLLGGLDTGLEVILVVGLLAGFYLRWLALASSILLLLFAVAVASGLGVESAFSYSTWTAAAAAFLLFLDLDNEKATAHS